MTTNDAIFMHDDVQGLFRHRTVIVLGDSIQRSVYKDLVCLFSDPSSGYVLDHELRAKGELSFRNDQLIRGGVKGEKVNGTNYREEREYREGNTVFRFYFITRCWNEYVESIVNNDLTSTVKPDVIIMNSCYWDIHHYGKEARHQYQEYLNKLFTAISRLPSRPLLVWNAALPLADLCKGGFLRKGFKTLPRHEVDRANVIAQIQTQRFNFIYVDLYRSISRHEIFCQAEDGIHWSNRAHRNMSNSILTAICQRWNMNVPVPVTLLPPRYQHLEWSPFSPQQILPPGAMLTPPVQNRYHPYFAAPLLRNKGMLPMAHHRSFTDPFPLASQQLINQEIRNNQYRARFMKMNKIKTPSGTPLSRNRHPLKEPNTSVKPGASSSPAAKPANSESTTKQDSTENSYKDCEDCACHKDKTDDCEKPVDSESATKQDGKESTCKDCEDSSSHKDNTDDGSDNTYRDCEHCGPSSSKTNQDSVPTSTNVPVSNGTSPESKDAATNQDHHCGPSSSKANQDQALNSTHVLASNDILPESKDTASDQDQHCGPSSSKVNQDQALNSTHVPASNGTIPESKDTATDQDQKPVMSTEDLQVKEECKADNKAVDSTDKLLDNHNDDMNNNTNDRSSENIRKRKRENDDDNKNDIDQPKKATKLA